MMKSDRNNPIKSLQGRIPGVNVSADGNPSGAATVRIRGIGTLNSNDPLYVIDGVPTKRWNARNLTRLILKAYKYCAMLRLPAFTVHVPEMVLLLLPQKRKRRQNPS